MASMGGTSRRGRPFFLRKRYPALLVLLGLAFVMGYARFVTELPNSAPDRPEADAIIVWTGGGDRIAAGMELLSQGGGERLLISGVNDKIERGEIKELIAPEHHEKFDCCVDLGTDARNTIGNAEETLSWVNAHDYQKIILVTAYYHMPRSLLELKGSEANMTIVAYPVFPHGINRDGWWHDPRAIRLLMMEYTKYLVAQVRFRLNLI